MEVNITNSVIKIPIPLSRRFKRVVLGVISAFALFATGYFFIDFNHSNEEIFEDYYSTPIIISRGSNTEVGLLMKGHYFIQEHEFAQAINEFRKVAESKGVLSDHGQWYLCLCMIKTNASEKSILELLCEIIKSSDEFSDRALEILSIKMDGADYHNKRRDQYPY